jgi:hypothetical protein
MKPPNQHLVVYLAISVSTVLTACARPMPAQFAREIPWAGRGVWLKADTHVHTDDFSDGGYALRDVAGRAAESCDVLAITDHLDVNLHAATPEYFAAIDAARRAHPALTILAGGEWNIPPWGGDEHATVLVSPAVETRLAEFKRLFDDHRRPTHDAALAVQALQWLAENASPPGAAPVVVYEHPSRPDDRSIDNATDVREWRRVNDLVIGFAGAPGHQAMKPYGDYEREQPIDRWDPAVARTGGAWDTLLGEGLDVWGAYVTSDFHTDKGRNFSDFWPCQFGATWLYAPGRDADAVLQALRAGSFFGEHGGIVRDVELRVSAAGLSRPAGAGEVIAVSEGADIEVTISFRVPTEGSPAAPRGVDRVQLIAIDEAGARIEFEGRPGPESTLTHTLPVSRGLVLRARGFRELSEEDRLAFYTNPIRVIVR